MTRPRPQSHPAPYWPTALAGSSIARAANPLWRISGTGFHAVSWHPDGHRIAVARYSAKAHVYDISGDEPKKKLTVKGGDLGASVDAVAFSPDGTWLATGSNKRWPGCGMRPAGGSYCRFATTMRCWRWRSARMAPGWPPAARTQAPGSGMRPAGSSCSRSTRPPRSWPWRSARTAPGWPPAARTKAPGSGTRPAGTAATASPQSWVLAVAFSPDGTRLATGSKDASVRLWDASNGQQLLQLRHNTAVLAVAFSPDGTRLATSSRDVSVWLWDAASGQQLLEVRHDYAVLAVAFSPDGTRLATGADLSVKIWQVAGL